MKTTLDVSKEHSENKIDMPIFAYKEIKIY